MAAVLAGFTDEQNTSVREWVKSFSDTRMELVGTAGRFIYDLDTKQKEVISYVGTESGWMNDRVAEIALLEDAVEKTYADLQQLNIGTTAFAEETKASIAAGAAANEEAIKKANYVHD